MGRYELTTQELTTQPYGSHMRMLDFVGKTKKVLEVGCATGYLSKFSSS